MLYDSASRGATVSTSSQATIRPIARAVLVPEIATCSRNGVRVSSSA